MDQKSRFDPKRYADLRIVKDLVSYLAEDLPPGKQFIKIFIVYYYNDICVCNSRKLLLPTKN